MKRKFLIGLLTLAASLLAIPAHAGWVSGSATNPSANDVIVDTGPLAMSTRGAMVIVGATIATRFVFQWRNAANDDTLKELTVIVAANQTVVVPAPLSQFEWAMATDERLRVIVQTGILGTAHATIMHGD